MNRTITRRQFLRAAGLTVFGVALGSAGTGRALGIDLLPHKAYLPMAVRATGQPPKVALVKAATYDRALVKGQLQAAMEGIGGLADIAHGKKVGIKVNLTGGVNSEPVGGPPAVETYITHPEVVRALCELLRDAGATATYLVEAAYEDASWSQWGYRAIVEGTSTQIVDLTVAPGGNDDNYVTVPTSSTPYYYDSFRFHPILTEIDSLVSVSKMKCHNIAGVTHSLKNLFGLVPYRFYRLDPADRIRTAFHSTNPGVHVPGTIVDLHSARRIDLSIIDGILSAEGGEGPWIKDQFQPVSPGLLLAGKDPVATDAVATACMGFDPTADYPNPPFVNGINHLAMVASRGMGCVALGQIQVVGESIADVKMNFAVSY